MKLSLILGASALALVLALAVHPGPAALAVAALTLGMGLLPTGRRTVLAVVAVALVSASPALAQATAPTWGVWGALSPAVDQGASWLVGGALSAIGAVLYALFRVTLPAVLEYRLRQTMLTGAHMAVLEIEQRVEAAWTPARRKAAVEDVVAHAMDRMPWAVARLKLTQRAVSGMALKMLDEAIAGRGPAVVPPAPGLPLLLPGAALGTVGAAPSSAAPAACATCGATDADRLSRGCMADGCPQVPAADPVAAAATAALAVPGMLFGGLAPAGG